MSAEFLSNLKPKRTRFADSEIQCDFELVEAPGFSPDVWKKHFADTIEFLKTIKYVHAFIFVSKNGDKFVFNPADFSGIIVIVVISCIDLTRQICDLSMNWPITIMVKASGTV